MAACGRQTADRFGNTGDLDGVIVLFVQIGALCANKSLCDKDLQIPRFSENRPFPANWYAFAASDPRPGWDLGPTRAEFICP
jgi:hypothetical protein